MKCHEYDTFCDISKCLLILQKRTHFQARAKRSTKHKMKVQKTKRNTNTRTKPNKKQHIQCAIVKQTATENARFKSMRNNTQCQPSRTIPKDISLHAQLIISR